LALLTDRWKAPPRSGTRTTTCASQHTFFASFQADQYARHDEGHLDEDDDPTIGLNSGKAKASRETGGFMPWTEGDMGLYRAKWPLGTEARLRFDVQHYSFLRVGDAHRFGPPHLRQIVRKMAVQVATEKSRTTATVPEHPEFAESLRAARAAGIIGAEVFTGKMVKGRMLPMNKKTWAAEVQEVQQLQ
jgi:hypothetical protein